MPPTYDMITLAGMELQSPGNRGKVPEHDRDTRLLIGSGTRAHQARIAQLASIIFCSTHLKGQIYDDC